MSKLSVEDLAEVLRASQRMHGHPEERVDALVQAVRAEAEARVWVLLEKVLRGGGGRLNFCFGRFRVGIYGDQIFSHEHTAREAVEAAAKELGINTEEVESCQE